MAEITITFEDGSKETVPSGTLIVDILRGRNNGDKDSVVAATVDGKAVDLQYRLTSDCKLCFISLDSALGRQILRHSTSHIMASAVKALYNGVQVSIGPAIEEGFYYDFDYSRGFTPEDLKRIEKKMEELIREDLPFVREELPKDQALKLFEKLGEPYKIELLQEIQDEKVSLYRSGDFVDLCRGPHIPTSGRIKAFRLLRVSGAYWKGDERNKMLQRIYGTAFPSDEELDQYLKRMEEAKQRDHRLLGKQLDLFSTHDLAGAGLVYWHPKGALIRELIEDFWRREHRKRGYQIVYSPHLFKSDLLRVSGHLEFYRENMYSPMDIDGVDYFIKPMNCPGHILIYQSHIRSYRELPLRYAELGTVYRYERAGTLHGMLRVRGFTQDDAHIFCMPKQLKDEILGVLQLADFMMNAFDYDYEIFLATRPEKFKGTEEIWQKATSSLEEALKEFGRSYEIDPGGGVFYGPKIDIKLIDALGRKWQGPTIQVDFNFPESFGIEYMGGDGDRHLAVMIHRTVLGSMERFIGGLIEHYNGAFPFWLSPVQVAVLTITDRCIEYAEKVARRLEEEAIRVEKDFRNEKLGLKVREQRLKKVPYMVVIGDKEVSRQMVSLRSRSEGDLGMISMQGLLNRLGEERSWIRP